MTFITYVDEDDNVIGAGPRDAAWEQGIIHRIVRIHLANSAGDVLLQKRALTRELAPGKWDIAAAGHVDEREEYEDAAYRELKEELGIEDARLIRVSKYFWERSSDDHSIRQFTMLFTSIYDGDVRPDPDEVAEIRWVSMSEWEALLATRPDEFMRGAHRAFELLQKAR